MLYQSGYYVAIATMLLLWLYVSMFIACYVLCPCSTSLTRYNEVPMHDEQDEIAEEDAALWATESSNRVENRYAHTYKL